MRAFKSCYFLLCFAVIFIFFYFFCNSNKRQSDERNQPFKERILRSGYETLVAYSEDNEPEKNSLSCDPTPSINEDFFVSDGIWQTAVESKVFLYSAFIDYRARGGKGSKYHVRILAMSEGVNVQPLYCQIWYNTENATITRIQKDEIWINSWDFANSSQYYRPYIFSCPVRKNDQELPNAVSVVREPCQSPRNLLPLKRSLPVLDNEKKEFVVCLKAMNFDGDISLRFLEWAELQFLLGADKIAAYVYDVHPNIMKALRYYEGEGKLSVKYHSLPGKGPNEPKSRSEFFKKNVWQKRRHEIIPYNDCLYDHVNSHKYVVILDLDEAIVPMMHMNWSEMLDHIFDDHKNALSSYCSLSATNVYFFDDFGEYVYEDIPKYMHMLRHVYRSANFSAPGFAVKSFHAVNNTLAVFNHYTLLPLYPDLKRNALIGRHLAQMHHYRSTCPPRMDLECRTNFMKFYKKDTALWKFKHPLIQKVNKIAQELKLIS